LLTLFELCGPTNVFANELLGLPNNILRCLINRFFLILLISIVIVIIRFEDLLTRVLIPIVFLVNRSINRIETLIYEIHLTIIDDKGGLEIYLTLECRI
jgi:hypothetical protein